MRTCSIVKKRLRNADDAITETAEQSRVARAVEVATSSLKKGPFGISLQRKTTLPVQQRYRFGEPSDNIAQFSEPSVQPVGRVTTSPNYISKAQIP